MLPGHKELFISSLVPYLIFFPSEWTWTNKTLSNQDTTLKSGPCIFDNVVL